MPVKELFRKYVMNETTCHHEEQSPQGFFQENTGVIDSGLDQQSLFNMESPRFQLTDQCQNRDIFFRNETLNVHIYNRKEFQ